MRIRERERERERWGVEGITTGKKGEKDKYVRFVKVGSGRGERRKYAVVRGGKTMRVM